MKKLSMLILIVCSLILSSLTLSSCDKGDEVPSLKPNITNKDDNDADDTDTDDVDPSSSDDNPSETKPLPATTSTPMFTQSDTDWLNEIKPTFPTDSGEKEIHYTLASDIDVTVDERVLKANLCDNTMLLATYTNVDGKLVLDDGYDTVSLASNKRYMLTFQLRELGEKLKTLSSVTSKTGDIVGFSSNKTFIQLQVSGAVSFNITTEARPEHFNDTYVSSTTLSIKVDKDISNARLIKGTNTIVEFDVDDNGMLKAKKDVGLTVGGCYSLIFEYKNLNTGIDEIIKGDNNISSLFKSINDNFINIYIDSKTEFEITTRIRNEFVAASTLDIEVSENIKGAKLYLEDKLVAVYDTNGQTLHITPNYQNVKIETGIDYVLIFDYKEDNLKIGTVSKNNSNNSIATLNEEKDCVEIILGTATSIKVEAVAKE